MTDMGLGAGLSSELAAWLKARQSLLAITTTTVTSSGQTLDWVPVDSQTDLVIATPPADVAGGPVIDPARPTSHADFEAIEAGPAGHVPILRPDLSRLKARKSMEQVFVKRGGLSVNRQRRALAPGDPNPAGYFHCTTAQSITAYGCDARLNVWDPVVDIPSSPGDDHSISQTWLQNYQSGTTQSLEAGLTVDHGLNGDSANHLFTYYTTNSYSADGDNKGGYNRQHAGWVQYHPSIFPGIRINGSSIPGGTQLELGIKFQLYQGNWWFGIDNSGSWTWIGYYPATLFPGGLDNHGEWVSFGGEIDTALSNPCETADQMGSGWKASMGWTLAAFQRNLRYQSSTSGGMSDFDGTAEVDTAAGNCPAGAYTIETHLQSGTSWASYQYYGGSASLAAGDATGYMFNAQGTQHVVFRGADSDVHELWWDNAGWHHNDLTAAASGAPNPAGDLDGYAFDAQGTQHVNYRGADNHIHELWWDNAGWHHNDLTIAA